MLSETYSLAQLPMSVAVGAGRGLRDKSLDFAGDASLSALSAVLASPLADEAINRVLASPLALLLAITITIAISVYAHGLTAGPLTERYVRWWTSHPRDAKPAMEDVPSHEHRWRRPVTRPDVDRGVDEAGAPQR